MGWDRLLRLAVDNAQRHLPKVGLSARPRCCMRGCLRSSSLSSIYRIHAESTVSGPVRRTSSVRCTIAGSTPALNKCAHTSSRVAIPAKMKCIIKSTNQSPRMRYDAYAAAFYRTCGAR
jgi:hypothetical protein